MEKEKCIFQQRPTPITWCILCKQDHCKEDCGSARFDKEAGTLRGDTPVAALVEEGSPDISAREFVERRTRLINERHSKNVLRNAILSLYARLQASLDLGEWKKEFNRIHNANPPGQDILARICEIADKEPRDWPGAIERIEKWRDYVDYVYRRIWPLFPNVPNKERTSGTLFRRFDELNTLWHTVVRNATGYTFAHGVPADMGEVEDLQH